MASLGARGSPAMPREEKQMCQNDDHGRTFQVSVVNNLAPRAVLVVR